ncbi:single-stranded DNA-binding protein [Mycoplasmopsis felifaucium]|uniref:single-stranded DNA-binding protein n=1 Tax=Mycoplasmopsis felifaucium TaxID=35768 RepID=UPI00068AE68F|nr:single-stranded DNA-binding protein [Mycoplasmopsis felifaucium]
MNKVLLVGRLTADPKLFSSQNGNQFTQFSIAVNNRTSKDSNNVDFIQLIAWDNIAKFVVDYLSKGALISIEAKLSTITRQQNGKNLRNIMVTATSIQVLESKSKIQQRQEITNSVSSEEKNLQNSDNGQNYYTDWVEIDD